MAQPGAGVPESVLKKRKRDDEWATKKASQIDEKRKANKGKRRDIFKRAEQYVKEYRQQVRHGSRASRGTLPMVALVATESTAAWCCRLLRRANAFCIETCCIAACGRGDMLQCCLTPPAW